MNRRRFLLAAPVVLGGCAFLRPARQTDRVAIMNGFVALEDRLVFSGDIAPGAADVFEAVRAQNPEVRILQIDAATGHQGEAAALELGRAVRAAGFGTELKSDAIARGAAVDVFLAGQPRRIGEGAALVWRGQNLARNPAYADYLAQMTDGAQVGQFVDDTLSRLRARQLELFEIQMLGLATDGVDQPFGEMAREVT